MINYNASEYIRSDSMFHEQFYFQLLFNFIYFLVREQFVYHFSQTNDSTKKHILRFIFLGLDFIYTVVPDVPSIFTILLDFIYICIVVNESLKYKIILLLKYHLVTQFFFIFILINLQIILDLLNVNIPNESFKWYNYIIVATLLYIAINLYINSKSQYSFNIHRAYRLKFNLVFTVSLLALIVLNILLFTNILNVNNVMPITYLIVLMILASVSIYQSLISTLKNEVTQSMLLENERLEKDYYRKVNDSLQSVNTLKHDFKNHLAIINHYAENGENESLCQYLQKISDTIGNETIVRTSHPIVSSILSVKKQDCIERGIQFQHSLNFGYLYISDFDITTILGNILDNAITAASKCKNPNIFISLHQLDSYLEIDCKNNHMENLKKTKGGFLSTKKDQNILHGIGLKNVENTTSRLNGKISFTYDSETFEVNILFPNYES